MKIAIGYSSKTGNTRMLAEAIEAALPQNMCSTCGMFDAKTAEAEFIFAGFWTDKGNCDENCGKFLETLHSKKLFLFGTAGFGEDHIYFERILSNVKTHIDASNQVVDTYMCQGKMPLSVKARYEAMQAEQPTQMKQMIANFDKAMSHPDADDLALLAQKVQMLSL
ncbi:MAG: flavodoxin family protein [Ruthenibacterium sp.]